jgi:hypothetical protein
MLKNILKNVQRLFHLTWKLFGYPDDYEVFLKKEKKRNYLYTKICGYANLEYFVNLNNPESFNEKLIHRRLSSRDPLIPIITDKVNVREWIKEKGLHKYVNLIPVIDIIDDVDKINLESYREPFIIKAAWASGLNIISIDGKTYFNKKELDKNKINPLMKKWAKDPYKIHRLIWASHLIPRRYVVEKMLLDKNGKPPKDYKFFVYHGKVEMFQIQTDRFGNHTESNFSRNKELLDITRKNKKSIYVELPSQIDDLIYVAERLGENFDFVRVDLYLYNGDIYFGEFTITPANGFGGFKPIQFDFDLGKKWNYDKENPVLISAINSTIQ